MRKEDGATEPRLKHLNIEEATRDTPNFKNTIKDLSDWITVDLTEQIKPLLKLVDQVAAAQSAYFDLKHQLLFKVADLANHIMVRPPSRSFLGDHDPASSTSGGGSGSGSGSGGTESEADYPLAIKSIMSSITRADNTYRNNVKQTNKQASTHAPVLFH